MRDDLVLDIKEKDPNISQSNMIPSETLDACISLVEIMYKILRTVQMKLTLIWVSICLFMIFSVFEWKLAIKKGFINLVFWLLKLYNKLYGFGENKCNNFENVFFLL